MFIVTVSVREVTPEGDEVIRVGKLYLVDLAGSENISRCVACALCTLGYACCAGQAVPHANPGGGGASWLQPACC